MKITKAISGIRDCRSCNLMTFSPLKIGDCSYKISLQPLREGRVISTIMLAEPIANPIKQSQTCIMS